MALGLYISVPFCKQKCTFCNFASGVFSRAKMQAYVDRVCDDISRAGVTAVHVGGWLGRVAVSLYLVGGTPTVLAPEWGRRGGAGGSLGYPLAAATIKGTVTSQTFQGGTLSYDSATGAFR